MTPTGTRASGRHTTGAVELPATVAAEAGRVLASLTGAPTAAPPAIQALTLKRRVYRVRAAGSATASVIVKQLDATIAERNRLVAERWLPAIGLGASAPALLGLVAPPDPARRWLIFEDVGGVSLKDCQDAPGSVRAAVQTIADLHTRAAGHAIVDDCLRHDVDLGTRYFVTNVRNAANLLDALRPPVVTLSRAHAGLRDRLRGRLDALLAEQPRRARLMQAVGGPTTLLHGDLWTTNVMIVGGNGERFARLIDWDHVGAGPVCYDLSTLLFRFPRAARDQVLAAYGRAVAHAGWRLPTRGELNLLCDTAECARYANRITWPALALLEDGAAWGFDELAEIEQWFAALEPVLDA